MKNLGLEKGTRKLVNHEERGRVLQAMDGCSYKAAAGGSLSNTLVALARLGGRSLRDPAINVGMAGSVASDLLGGFYRFAHITAHFFDLIDMVDKVVADLVSFKKVNLKHPSLMSRQLWVME